MSVRVGGVIHCHIEPGQDNSSDEAIGIAQEVLRRPLMGRWIDAHVNFADGLCISYNPVNDEAFYGVHFRSLKCGCEGAGTIDCARVLEMFGFGNFAYIYNKISQGGKYSNYTLEYPARSW